MSEHDTSHTVRLNRFLASAGFGSRRGVEDLVREGRVSLNGEVVTNLGTRVRPESDSVEVDGRIARLPEKRRIYAFHKPRGVVSTLKSQKQQPCLLPFRIQGGLPEQVMPVGRLDAETTGLLLWTDDGDLAQALCRPSSGVWKTYEVELRSRLTKDQGKQLTAGGLELNGRPCRPCRLKPGHPADGRHWVIELHEGRKRQIRRMMSAVGTNVLTLKRVAFGPIELRHLQEGCFRRLNQTEETSLRRTVSECK